MYLKKKLTGGSAYFFGSEILIFLFFWVWKNLSLFFLGLKIFHLFFGGNNFNTIYFFGCPIKRSWFAKPLTEIRSNSGTQNIEQQLARKNWSCANMTYAQSTYFFGSVIFMNLFFWVWFFLVFIFWVSQKIPGPSPPVMYTLWDMTFVKHRRNNPTCDPWDSQGNEKMQFLFLLLLALIFLPEMKISFPRNPKQKTVWNDLACRASYTHLRSWKGSQTLNIHLTATLFPRLG